MTAAAIDLNVLNELLDNQKKLDDIFGSLFDDDSFLNASSYDEVIPSSNEKIIDQASYAINDTMDELIPESRGFLSLATPVIIEIATIYYGIMYFY